VGEVFSCDENAARDNATNLGRLEDFSGSGVAIGALGHSRWFWPAGALGHRCTGRILGRRDVRFMGVPSLAQIKQHAAGGSASRL
jgi:hypothetical protein